MRLLGDIEGPGIHLRTGVQQTLKVNNMGEILFDGKSDYKIKVDYKYFAPELEQLFFFRAGAKLTEIVFSPVDLFYDIVTCGIPEFWINGNCHKKRSDEIRYKVYLMRAALEVDENGYIIVSNNIKYLDSSERNFIAYYIGMFMTKLVSREIFGYDYLVHLGIVSTYKKVIRGSKEPDLVGFKKHSDEYILFEAKGRKAVKSQMVNDAKTQLQSVKYISGSKITTGVVCVAHPIREGSRVVCSMYDPVPEGEGAIDVSKWEMLYLYYLPAYELIKEKGGGRRSCSIYFDEGDFLNKFGFRFEVSKELFGFFEEHSDFHDLEKKECWLKLMEIVSEPTEKGLDDLLMIELSY